MSQRIIDRSSIEPLDTVSQIWQHLGLPQNALSVLELTGRGSGYVSSYKVDHLAQASIALSALSAALVDSLRRPESSLPRKVTVPLEHACIELKSERLYTIAGYDGGPLQAPIGGLHRTSDGYVRIHDSFSNHRNGTLKLLGLENTATREQVAERVVKWAKLDLEQSAYENKLAIYALRSYGEWDSLPQAQALPDLPISVIRIAGEGPKGLPAHMLRSDDRCLRGLRVLELSRVLAAPVAGRTLAAHGADVLWVTSPTLPDLPELDKDTTRGKRTIQLDLHNGKDCNELMKLIKDCDVFLQSYRPESLSSRGFGPEALAAINPSIIYASLTAFGTSGPWADRRGFDSLVQTCSGMNVSEAEHFGQGEHARPLPAQALDHASGYFLATGIACAVYKRAKEGGSWRIDVSLAGTMHYLRSLGQIMPSIQTGAHGIPPDDSDVPDIYFEEQQSGFGKMRALRHSATVEGAKPGWDHMPKTLGSDEPRWM
ncbi:hypothetical protein LTR78_006784 [Recurvomyces mirabilis]|uniref:CoA-transferase family III n=1 Tax=Recurvomyces mirabilis TaxID=574656 RepID=A0AAE1BZF4_9PEZI|nr:hypothetical protein LTR78_006784 [Recurvomyces mirabilis]KAK5153226.1 hypothetical protein LTS14_007871 [Recurvomyces mirabilis]